MAKCNKSFSECLKFIQLYEMEICEKRNEEWLVYPELLKMWDLSCPLAVKYHTFEFIRVLLL